MGDKNGNGNKICKTG